MNSKAIAGVILVLGAGLVYKTLVPTVDTKTISKLKEVTTKYEESQKKVQEYATKLTESETQLKTLTNWSKLDQTQYELREKIAYYENGNKKTEARTITKKTQTQIDYSQYVELFKYEKIQNQVVTITEENTQLKLKIEKMSTTITTNVVRNWIGGVSLMSDKSVLARVGYNIWGPVYVDLSGELDILDMQSKVGLGASTRF